VSYSYYLALKVRAGNVFETDKIFTVSTLTISIKLLHVADFLFLGFNWSAHSGFVNNARLATEKIWMEMVHVM
jgi:hypothetical protein